MEIVGTLFMLMLGFAFRALQQHAPRKDTGCAERVANSWLGILIVLILILWLISAAGLVVGGLMIAGFIAGWLLHVRQDKPQAAGNTTRDVPQPAAPRPEPKQPAVRPPTTRPEYVSVPGRGATAAFQIMRTPVTNALWRDAVDAGACQPPARTEAYDNPAKAQHPVVWITRAQAQAYAAWIGGRLPRDDEWTRAAQGDDGRTYPWGNETPDDTLANYDDNVGGTTTVTTYPAGASPYGALDMAGNVWEWVEHDATRRRDSVRGGSYTRSAASLTCDSWTDVTADGYAGDIGFRVVATQQPSVMAPPTPPPASPQPKRDRAGAEYRWVPAGAGLAGFWMMRTPVTNALWRAAVEAGVVEPPSWTGDYNKDSYAQHPVMSVTREQVRTYAAWVAGRLPRDAEWTRAAQGDDGRTYPWGNTPPDATRANCRPHGPGDTTPVGSYPAGASPYGLLDVAGNVWEWVDDGDYVVRGGAFDTDADDVMCGARLKGDYVNDLYVGFRVVSPGP